MLRYIILYYIILYYIILYYIILYYIILYYIILYYIFWKNYYNSADVVSAVFIGRKEPRIVL